MQTKQLQQAGRYSHRMAFSCTSNLSYPPYSSSKSLQLPRKRASLYPAHLILLFLFPCHFRPHQFLSRILISSPTRRPLDVNLVSDHAQLFSLTQADLSSTAQHTLAKSQLYSIQQRTTRGQTSPLEPSSSEVRHGEVKASDPFPATRRTRTPLRAAHFW
jgi:hypothetical protein